MASPIDNFKQYGFAVLHDVLIPCDIAALNSAIDRDHRANPGEWTTTALGAVTSNAQLRTPAFDSIMQHPMFTPIIIELMGPLCCLESMRLIVTGAESQRGAHADWQRGHGRSETHPHGLRALSAVVYLSDITTSESYYSIIPRTHESELAPVPYASSSATDVVGLAGTVFLYHSHSVYRVVEATNAHPTRRIELSYGFADAPPHEATSTIPMRLKLIPHPSLPPEFYQRATAT